MCNLFVNNIKNYNYETTIGVEFFSRYVNVNYSKNNEFINRQLKVHIWDTAGQETFRGMLSCYYRTCAGILLFLDLSDRESFINLDYCLKQIELNGPVIRPPIMLFCNKKDLDKHTVSREEIDDYCKTNNLMYSYTSINEPKTIHSAINILLVKISQLIDDEDDPENIVGVKKNKDKNKFKKARYGNCELDVCKERECFNCNIL